jgi:hypothetical protein
MMNDIATLTLTDSELKTWIREACDSAAVCQPGTATHKIRVAHLGKLCAELRRRGG